MLLLELNILSVQGVDTVNHALDKFNLGVTETVLVGDIVGVTSLATRFTAGTPRLDLEFFTPVLEGFKTFLGPAGQVNVDGGSHASTKIGWAGVDVAVLGIKHEVLAGFSLDGITDGLNTAGKAFKDTSDITALLHGDDPKLIFLIDPDEERLFSIVEDTTTFGPVALHTGNLKVTITRHEEEVIINELLADLLIHTSKWVVATGEITSELAEGRLHQVFNSNALFLGDAWGETEAIDGATDTDSDGVDGDFWVDVTLDLLNIHVGCVDGIGRDTVVFLDEWVEDILEVLVGIPVTSIDTTVLVVELDSAGNGCTKSEARGGGLVGSEFIPFFLGDVLGNQGVLGLNVGEITHD